MQFKKKQKKKRNRWNRKDLRHQRGLRERSKITKTGVGDVMDTEEGGWSRSRGFSSMVSAGGLNRHFRSMSSLRLVRRWRKIQRCWSGEKEKSASSQRCLWCWGEENGGRKRLVVFGRMENVWNTKNLIGSQQEAPHTSFPASSTLGPLPVLPQLLPCLLEAFSSSSPRTKATVSLKSFLGARPRHSCSH